MLIRDKKKHITSFQEIHVYQHFCHNIGLLIVYFTSRKNKFNQNLYEATDFVNSKATILAGSFMNLFIIFLKRSK